MASGGESVGDNYKRLWSYQNSAIVHTFGKLLGDILSPVWRNYSHVITNITPAAPDCSWRTHGVGITGRTHQAAVWAPAPGHMDRSSRDPGSCPLIGQLPAYRPLIGHQCPRCHLETRRLRLDQFVSNSRPGWRGPGADSGSGPCRGSGEWGIQKLVTD